jgi:hypothetical protein
MCKRHDFVRPQVQDLRQTEQVWPEVDPGATFSHLELQEHPKQSHGVHAVLPRL